MAPTSRDLARLSDLRFSNQIFFNREFWQLTYIKTYQDPRRLQFEMRSRNLSWRFERIFCNSCILLRDFGQLSRLCKELLLLPFGLAETRGIQKVVECFSSYVKWLSEFPVPSDLSDLPAFTKLLKQILQVRKTAGMVGDENSGGVE